MLGCAYSATVSVPEPKGAFYSACSDELRAAPPARPRSGSGHLQHRIRRAGHSGAHADHSAGLDRHHGSRAGERRRAHRAQGRHPRRPGVLVPRDQLDEQHAEHRRLRGIRALHRATDVPRGRLLALPGEVATQASPHRQAGRLLLAARRAVRQLQGRAHQQVPQLGGLPLSQLRQQGDLLAHRSLVRVRLALS